jgi:hypothetical protein
MPHGENIAKHNGKQHPVVAHVLFLIFMRARGHSVRQQATITEEKAFRTYACTKYATTHCNNFVALNDIDMTIWYQLILVIELQRRDAQCARCS